MFLPDVLRSPEFVDSRHSFPIKADLMSRMQADLDDSRSGSSTPPEPEMLRRVLPKGRRPHVCIVGAGFAGLKCADILLQHDVQVTIFEARNRIGGRLYQERVGGHLVDLGANWIHGTMNNPILDFVRQTKTLTHSWGERQVTFGPNGNKIPEDEVVEASETLWGIIGEAFKYSHDHSADIPADESLMDYIKERLDKMVTDPKQKDLILRLAEEWGPFIGATTDGQSLKYMWLEETLEGENLFCAGTYKKVLELVAKPALGGAKMEFGKKVVKMKSNEEGGKPVTTVESSDGKARTFDEVVVTAPLGWLKRNKEAFEPSLPTRLQEAIESLGYGNLDKVYISFPQAFWDSPAPSATEEAPSTAAPSASSMPNTTATTAPIHHPEPNGTANGNTTKEQSTSISTLLSTPSTHYPGFTHYLNPNYASTNPHHYTQEAVNLAALPAPVAHATLLFYTSGPNTTQISNILKANPKPAARKAALLHFFKPYFSLLPNYSPTNPACVPTDALATGWEIDEYAGYGSYTNIPTGVQNPDDDVRVLRKGLPERGVWIAGEHTSPFVALGTVTGAWWSGEGVAKRIVEAYGCPKVKEDWYQLVFQEVNGEDGVTKEDV